jgi:hypothetical protein
VQDCWANELGHCSNKMSKEHTVTAGLFTSDRVVVKGFPWCREFKEIGLPNLVGKVLCKKHNSDLSVVDAVSIETAKIFRQFVDLQFARAEMAPRRWTYQRFPINGSLLERWCLKTLINIAFGKPNRIGNDSQQDGRPSKRLVKIAYGIEVFRPRAGLYALGHEGLTLKFTEGIQIISLLNQDAVCVGAVSSFMAFHSFFIWTRWDYNLTCTFPDWLTSLNSLKSHITPSIMSNTSKLL